MNDLSFDVTGALGAGDTVTSATLRLSDASGTDRFQDLLSEATGLAQVLSDELLEGAFPGGLTWGDEEQMEHLVADLQAIHARLWPGPVDGDTPIDGPRTVLTPILEEDGFMRCESGWTNDRCYFRLGHSGQHSNARATER